MELHSGQYTLAELLGTTAPMVPRGVFMPTGGCGASLALEYHSGLLPLRVGDAVHISLHTERPAIPQTSYLMHGIVDEIEDELFVASFGGLLLIYKGELPQSLRSGMEVYVAAERL